MKFLSLIKSSGGKPVGKHSFSYTVGGSLNWFKYLENNLVISNNCISRLYLVAAFTCMHNNICLNNCEQPTHSSTAKWLNKAA